MENLIEYLQRERDRARAGTAGFDAPRQHGRGEAFADVLRWISEDAGAPEAPAIEPDTAAEIMERLGRIETLLRYPIVVVKGTGPDADSADAFDPSRPVTPAMREPVRSTLRLEITPENEARIAVAMLILFREGTTPAQDRMRAALRLAMRELGVYGPEKA